MRLGIAVVTYNRALALEGCLDAVARHTKERHLLLAADDGSDDGSRWLLGARGVPTVTGPRRGLGWNRNRALYYLMTRTTLTHFLILEDDCWPCADGWESDWLKGADRWGHLSFAWKAGVVSGRGTPESPWLSNSCGTQCVAVKRDAMLCVGYSDTRFRPPYGHEDTDWRWRFGRHFQTKRGSATLGLSSGLAVQQFGSWRDESAVRANGGILNSLSAGPVYRPPYRNLTENLNLVGEVISAGVPE